MTLLTDELRSWIGRRETSPPVELSRREIVKYSLATQQRIERYRRGDVAPPMFFFGAFRPLEELEDLREDGLSEDPLLPDLPLPRVMAGGSRFVYHREVGPGDVVACERELASLEEKQGSSGPLIFIEYRLTVRTTAGELVFEEWMTRIAR